MLPTHGYVDQSPDALRLSLVEGDLDQTQFELLGTCSGVIDSIKVTATVIGASHLISYSFGDCVMHEVFACVPPRLVASWPLDELLDRPVERQLPGLHYTFIARQITWEGPEPDELTRLVNAVTSCREMSGEFGVVQDFPTRDALITPKTVIFGRQAGEGRRGVSIETAHFYPNVRGLVLSRTTLYRI